MKPETPGPDDLSPAQVEILLKQNRAPFNAFAQKLTDAALVALKAVDARNVDGMYEAGDAIDQACENCHLNYWYPGPKSPVRNALEGSESDASRGEGCADAPLTNRRPCTDQSPSRSI